MWEELEKENAASLPQQAHPSFSRPRWNKKGSPPLIVLDEIKKEERLLV
jgi:hypothetical protein